MNTTAPKNSPLSNGRRIGFHYFADTLHFRDVDLATWLPYLAKLDAAWLVLRSEAGRAIPERFLRGLIDAGIEPVIHFFPSAHNSTSDLAEIRPIIEAYARWNVHYTVFFDQPNQRIAWPARNWIQQDPEKSFIDRFTPLAALAVQLGLTPVFPPLAPGGSYWDTAFLRAALIEMERRKQDEILRSLALSAYAWTFGHPLEWGAGGPERWPQARPYHSNADVQDQRGFHIFDWYQAVSQAVLQRTCPIFLFQAGSPQDPNLPSKPDEKVYAQTCVSIAETLAASPTASEVQKSTNPLPPQVMAACFWLLSAEKDDPYASQAWYSAGQSSTDQPFEKPAAASLREWQQARSKKVSAKGVEEEPAHPIKHYLLLPGYEWGISDWYLEVTRPFIKKYRPTVGFSIEEARLANKVTVVGNVPGFTREALEWLRKDGCEVDWIDGNGTVIASQLAER